MDNEGKNVQIFNDTMANLAETRPGLLAEQTTFLGLIARYTASIADSLEKMSDHMTADPFKKAFDDYRKAREEELHV